MKLLYLLPHFDENTNSFSKLLKPLLDELLQRGITFEIWSANRNYRGAYSKQHKTKFFFNLKYEFLSFPWNLFWGTSLAWLWKRKNSDGIVHNIGGGNSFFHTLITAHACHAQYIKIKKQYGETWRIFLNPIHGMILLTEWLNYLSKPITISVSPYNTLGLISHYPHLEKTIFTIENSAILPKVLKSRSSRSATQFKILFAGNNHLHKGLNPLLRSLVIAKHHGLDWKLTVAGVDRFEAKWKTLVQNLNLQDYVDFVGHSDDLAQLMAASDIFCLPSKYESFGMVFLEAALVGCPSFGTSVGILDSLYGDTSGPGLCKHPVNPEELFEGLKYWAEHAIERQNLAKIMAQRAMIYETKRMVGETFQIYDQLQDRQKK